MRKLAILVLAAATALMLAVGSGSAVAASGSERECDAGGGTYTKAGPDSICVFPETTKDVNGNAFGTATQETTTGQGNLGNKPTSECTGNQGQCKQQ